MEFFISNLNFGVGLVVLIEMGIAVLLFKQWHKDRSKMTMCMLLISVGLLIDAFLIALGSAKPEGISENVSRIRFVAHGALIPLMFPVCGYTLKASGKVMKILWVFTVIVMILGIAQGFATRLELVQVGNTLRHAASDATPVWAEKIRRLLSFGAVLPVMVVGLINMIKDKRPYIFLGGLFMFIFSAIGPATGNFDLIFFFSMIGEIFLCIFFYLNQTKHTV